MLRQQPPRTQQSPPILQSTALGEAVVAALRTGALKDTTLQEAEMFEVEHDRDEFLVCRLSGKLTKSDYQAMVPELENAMQLRSPPIRLLITLEDFRGWEFDALWEDLKLGMKHRNDFERIAVVGRSKAERWGTWLSKPLISGKVRFFDIGRRSAAEAWLSEGAAGKQGAHVGQNGKAD